MKNVLLSITIVLSIGCASHHDTFDVTNLEPSVQVHLNSYFIEKLRFTGHNFAYYNIKIKFENLLGNELAVCSIYKDKTQPRTIRIHPERWFAASESQREQLVFHEMGHCDLDIQKHTNSGIMIARQLQDSFYVNNREALVLELFDMVTEDPIVTSFKGVYIHEH